MVNDAEVRLWGETIGYLAWDQDEGVGSFEYEPEFSKSIEPSPLAMPNRMSQGRVYTFAALPSETFKGLPPMLSDSLPDDFGNAVINDWLARHGRDPRSCTPIERLLYIGSRGMGALEYWPSDNRNEDMGNIELKDLVAVINDLMSRRSSIEDKIDLSGNSNSNHEALKSLYQVGTSAGGARAKALVAINQEGNIRSGQLPAPEGYEQWMLKFDGIDHNQYNMDKSLGYGQIEYVYHLMAVKAGISMSECKLLEDGNRRHFMTKRFDRVANNKKIHMQTLCAMDRADYKKPGAYSYEQLFSVMRKLKLSRDEAIQQYRRMVFNVIARNQDDHTKNTGFLMDRSGKWFLSPAYDVTWSYKKDSPWVNQHQMSINGKRDGFSREDLLSVTKQIANFGEANDIIDEVIESVRDWNDLASDHGVDDRHIEAIASTHRVL